MASNVRVSECLIIGQDLPITVKIWTDSTRTTALDITGRTYTAKLATGLGESALASVSGSVTGATGTVTFAFTDTHTSLITTAGWYVIQITETNGSNSWPILVASVQFMEGVS